MKRRPGSRQLRNVLPRKFPTPTKSSHQTPETVSLKRFDHAHLRLIVNTKIHWNEFPVYPLN